MCCAAKADAARAVVKALLGGQLTEAEALRIDNTALAEVLGGTRAATMGTETSEGGARAPGVAASSEAAGDVDDVDDSTARLVEQLVAEGAASARAGST